MKAMTNGTIRAGLMCDWRHYLADRIRQGLYAV